MYNKILILVIVTYISLTACNLAPFITKCKWDDSKCLKETAQKAIPLFANGIPELNMDKLDPLLLEHVDASTSNLKLSVNDITVTGLKNCEAKKIQRDIGKAKLFVKLLCAANFNGKYDMKGQLFVLPIEGNGDLHVKVPKILISVDVDMADKTDKEGKNHWTIKAWKHTFDLKEKSDVKFENLFPDNEFLRNTTNELIAQNGNDVITEIGRPIIKAIVAKVLEGIKKFFIAVPTENLVLD